MTSETTIDAEVLACAREIFSTSEQADRWLNKRHLTLGMSPVEYLNSGGQKIEILKMLYAIAHGNAL